MTLHPSHDLHLPRLRAAIPQRDVAAPTLSRWTVGMHIEHCAMAMQQIMRQLADSQPPPPRDRFRWPRTVILLTGRIPRGRARAPESVVPEESPGAARLEELLEACEQQLSATRTLPRGAWFKHFALGVLDRDKSLRFLAVHNAHHLRLVGDILGAAH
jgi:hypothetical protein